VRLKTDGPVTSHAVGVTLNGNGADATNGNGLHPASDNGNGLHSSEAAAQVVAELVAEKDVCPAVSRLEALVDPGSFQPWRSAVGDGVVAGFARIGGRPLCVWTQDGRFKGGSLGAAGGETIVRTIRMASRAGIPVAGFPHSGGARLQEGVAALTAYGAIFREQARARVLQLTVISGPCAGGAAYSPALGDFVVMLGRDSRLFLTGPEIVERVTRERMTAEELGGPRVQTTNGVAHFAAADERTAADLLRELLGYLPAVAGGAPPLAPAQDPPPGNPAEPLPATTRAVYDVRDVIRTLVDGGHQLELAARWAPNMVTSFARLDGLPVGFICNQPRYLGGTIDCDAAEKGAWFVNLCDRFRLPLVVLVDTPGFLPGRNQERAGVIRHGASLLRAFGRATTPKLTVTLRQAYGGAHIVMNSRDLGADLALAWPGAWMGIMGAREAVAITERRAIAAGADIEALAATYAGTRLTIDSSARDGFVDEVVAPSETRARLIRALDLFATRSRSRRGAARAWHADEDDPVPGYVDDEGVPRPLM
jgi:acetyl-CoA carboxylase carboxyltransferase component